jgi:hypothetical protein
MPGSYVGALGWHVSLVSGTVIWRAEMIQGLIDNPTDKATIITINFDVLDDYYESIIANPHAKGEEGGYVFRNRLYTNVNEARIARAASSSLRISDLLAKWQPEAIVVDEAHSLATPGTHRSMVLRRLARGARYVRLLSGTPDPQKGPSFYSQYVVLDPTIFGTSKSKFLEKYFYLNPFIRGKIEGIKPTMAAEFYAKVRSVMQIVRAEDYFGPDEINEVTRELDWPLPAAQIYKTLQKDSVVNDDNLTIDGTHRLTKILRGLQLCAGFIQNEATGEMHTIHEEKTRAILADLSEPIGLGQRVVVSYHFNEQGTLLWNALSKAHGKSAVALVNGRTKDDVALEVLSLFDVDCKKPTPIKILIIQEQAGAEGISLARARHLFFSSWSMDSVKHAQMRKRIWHPELTSHISYYEMKKSVDGFARMIVQDKLDASIMSRKHTMKQILGGGPYEESSSRNEALVNR